MKCPLLFWICFQIKTGRAWLLLKAPFWMLKVNCFKATTTNGQITDNLKNVWLGSPLGKLQRMKVLCMQNMWGWGSSVKKVSAEKSQPAIYSLSALTFYKKSTNCEAMQGFYFTLPRTPPVSLLPSPQIQCRWGSWLSATTLVQGSDWGRFRASHIWQLLLQSGQCEGWKYSFIVNSIW